MIHTDVDITRARQFLDCKLEDRKLRVRRWQFLLLILRCGLNRCGT
jgi:hypothetical protein